MEKVLDMFGRELNIGDKVICMMRSQNQTEYMTTGEVVSFKKVVAGYITTIKMHSRYFHKKTALLENKNTCEVNVKDTMKSVLKLDTEEIKDKIVYTNQFGINYGIE